MNFIEMSPLISDADTRVGSGVGKWNEAGEIVKRVDHRAILHFIPTSSRRKAEISSFRKAIVAIVAFKLQSDAISQTIA